MKVAAIVLFLTTSLTFAQQRPQFENWDKDKNGKLSKAELPEGPRRNFDRVDTDKDGSISPGEHAIFLKRRRRNDNWDFTITRDIPYAGNDNPRQALDLFLPKKAKTEKPLPVIAFIHGGAWRAGNKSFGLKRLTPFVETGQYAGVSIAYRLTGEAIWPAQIHDCKAAIRWIHANAKQHNLDPNNIAVWGTSAGGHLVAMLGTSGDVEALEGEIGKHLDQSSRVDCVVNFFGPSELLTMADHPSTMDHNAPDSPESILVGGTLQDTKKQARSASPITHITKDDAPTLNVHGTADKLVPYPQSVDFHNKLLATDVSSNLITIDGGGHGSFGKAAAEVNRLVSEFLSRHLLGDKKAKIKDQHLDSE